MAVLDGWWRTLQNNIHFKYPEVGVLPYTCMCRGIGYGFGGYRFASVSIVFPLWSVDRICKLYRLKLQCVNGQLNKKPNSAKIVNNAILSRFVYCRAWLAVVWLLFFLEQGVIFRVWTILVCFILKVGQGLRLFEAHTYSKFTGVPPPPKRDSSCDLSATLVQFGIFFNFRLRSIYGKKPAYRNLIFSKQG